LHSVDGEWTLQKVLAKDGTFSVVTKRRDRRQSERSAHGVTSKEADKKITEIVKHLAGYQPVDQSPTTLPPHRDASQNAGTWLLVGYVQQNVGVTRLIRRAVARQVASSKIPPRVLDGDRQTARQQVVPVPTGRFVAAEAE